MTNPPRRPNSMRYAGYDYTAPGACLITFCAQRGSPLFGQVIDQEMQLTPLGAIASLAWPELVAGRAHVRLEMHVIMPNHGHALLLFSDRPAALQTTDPVVRRYGKPIAGSLSTLVATHKAEVTRRAKRRGVLPASPIWQAGFWDRIIRDERELETVRDYIRNNPARWVEDRLHPDAAMNQFKRSWRGA